MSMTTNKQTLREAAEKAKELGAISRYTKAAVARLEFKEAVTPDVVLALLDELEAAERRNAELAHHLKSAHQFIEHTEAFGYMAASGILQCSDAKWDVDASKESLRTAATDKGE